MKTVQQYLLVILCVSCGVPAQSGNDPRFSLSTGVGIGSHHSTADNPWLSLSICVTRQSGRTIFAARFVRDYRFDLEISMMGGGGFHNSEMTQELAILGGIHGAAGRSATMEIAAGPGLVTGSGGARYVEHGPPVRTSFVVAGAALHAAVYWRHIGLVGFANVNPAQTLGGFLLSFRFGPWTIRRGSSPQDESAQGTGRCRHRPVSEHM